MSELSDPIAQYYASIRQRQLDAWERWHKAKEAGLDQMELHRLWEEYIDAGYTGD